MNTRLIALACAACLVVPISAADQTELGKQMETFNDSYKAIRKESDPAKAAGLAREAQQALVKAMAVTPELVSKMPEGTVKAKAGAEYRKMIGQAFVSLCRMEAALLDGDTAAATEIATALKDLKKSGHDKFMEEEE